MEPIRTWYRLINSELSEQELLEGLKTVYQENPASVAEIIMTSYCPNRCRHCIYPPDYHVYHKNMRLDQWKEAFEILYYDLGMKRFIFDGRTLSRECIEAISFIKEKFTDSKVGLLCDGISAEPFLRDLIASPPDWVDISVDGLQDDHDTQRNFPGSFTKTVKVLCELKNSGRFEKVNILTCLTTINVGSVFEMIAFLNRKGFKNFFVTPIIVEGRHLDPKLRLSDEAFVDFIDLVLNRAGDFADTWLEIDIYQAIYMYAIKKLRPQLFKEFAMDGEHLEFSWLYGNNDVHICYYPTSLLGTREFILDSTGGIIPKVTAMESVSKSLTFGNILEGKTDRGFFMARTHKKEFSIFLHELLEEKNLLKDQNLQNDRAYQGVTDNNTT